MFTGENEGLAKCAGKGELVIEDVFLRKIVERDGRTEITTDMIAEAERHEKAFWCNVVEYAVPKFRRWLRNGAYGKFTLERGFVGRNGG